MKIFKQSQRSFFLPFSTFCFSTVAESTRPSESLKATADLSVFSSFQFNTPQVNFLVKKNPWLLEEADPIEIQEKMSHLKEALSLDDKQLKKILLGEGQILQLDKEEMQMRIKSLREVVPFTEKEFRKLCFEYPPIFMRTPRQVSDMVTMLTTYTEIPERTLAIAAARHPFLLAMDVEIVRADLKYFLKLGFTLEQLREIVDFLSIVSPFCHFQIKRDFLLLKVD